MPTLKTIGAGTTGVSGVKDYLESEQRQEREMYAQELDLYESGEIQLSKEQVGYLQDYLTGGSRALAIDVSDDLSRRNWARQMDLTRDRHGHGEPPKTGKARTYYHFVLSPDPDDECSLATLRAYARDWAEENFRNATRQHEYAIVPHDDNTRGILHAHIIVNVTDKLSGKKLHVPNDEVVSLSRSAQEIGRRYKLTPLREDARYERVGDVRTTQPVYLTRREREILNAGGYSWKWELRQAISNTAPLSRDFGDFKERMNRSGYDVTRDKKTGYLTYTHKNGRKARDSRLGARFYPEAIEASFNKETLLADKNYASWELIKISRGEIPWKEDIRRAVDALAPSIISLLDLQQRLLEDYGIEMKVNRRGITYVHAGGYKVRDVGIGLRYTADGLRQNAVLASPLPYPSYGDILERSTALTRQYMPRDARRGRVAEPAPAVAALVYRDVESLLDRHGLSKGSEVPLVIAAKRHELQDEKAALMAMRQELMRLNHLASLRKRAEKDREYLQADHAEEEPLLYNAALLRYERVRAYLNEQTGVQELSEQAQSLRNAYEDALDRYQERFNALEHDTRVYENYLSVQGEQTFAQAEMGRPMDVQMLFDASRTLSEYNIRDFFHLEQTVSRQQTRLDLVSHRLEKALERRSELSRDYADIRTIREYSSYTPLHDALQGKESELGLDEMKASFRQASERLASRGIEADGFDEKVSEYKDTVQESIELGESKTDLKRSVRKLGEALEVCLAVAEASKPSEQALDHRDKGIEKPAVSKEASEAKTSPKDQEIQPLDAFIDEIRRRRKERATVAGGGRGRDNLERDAR